MYRNLHVSRQAREQNGACRKGQEELVKIKKNEGSNTYDDGGKSPLDVPLFAENVSPNPVPMQTIIQREKLNNFNLFLVSEALFIWLIESCSTCDPFYRKVGHILREDT